MKIVRYYPRAVAGNGGMTGAVRRWSESLVRAGADVVVVHAGGGTPPPGPVHWVSLPHLGGFGLTAPIGLAEVIQNADVLVLHSGWTLHNVVAGTIARRLGVPYVLEPRGAYDPHITRRRRLLKKPWWLAMERRLVSHASAIHVFFESERAHLAALGYRGPVVVAPNGAPNVEAPSWDGGSGGYLLWLGRFDPEHKGLDLLLEAMSSLPGTARPLLRLYGPDWAGGKRVVVRLVAALGLDRSVLIGDPVYGATKRALLEQAKAFVYPSRWDACPNAVLEAIAVGVPTIVTPYPLGVYMGDAGGAVLCEASAAGLRRGIEVLEDRDSMIEMARTGVRVARQCLQWDAVGRSWLTQVEQVL
jgi:glycosyltransferase involved in cell wall biosynthesis